MSDQALGKFLRERWPQVLVLGVVTFLGLQFYNFNREVRELATGQNAIDSRMGHIETGIDKIDGRLDRLSELPTPQTSEQRTYRLDPWRLAIAVLSDFSNSLGRDVPGENLRRVAYTAAPVYGDIIRNINQCGTLSPETKVDIPGMVYRWPLGANIDPDAIQNICVSVENALPGAAISARISNDAQYFVIEVLGTGNTDIAQKLKAGVPACVSVLTLNSTVPNIPSTMMVEPAPPL